MIIEYIKGNPLDFLTNAVVCLMLIICSIDDIRTKTIRIKKLIPFTGILLIGMIIGTNISVVESIAGLSVGVIVILIAKLTNGQIGTGDGIILCVTGIGLGIWNNLEMFCYALMFAAFFSIFLLVRNMKNRKRKIPFVPFLFLGFLCCILIREIGI